MDPALRESIRARAAQWASMHAAEVEARRREWEDPTRPSPADQFLMLQAAADSLFPDWQDRPDPHRQAGVERVRATWAKLRERLGVPRDG